MALIKVTDRDGIEHDVEGNTSFTLMENLRDLDYGVAAVVRWHVRLRHLSCVRGSGMDGQVAARAFG